MPLEQSYEIDVPFHRGKPPLTANQRLHWSIKAERTAIVRSAVNLLARQLRIPSVGHITVQLHYATGDNRRRDGANLAPTQKPAVDGLVDAGVVPDDTGEYVTEYMPVVHNGPGKRRLWLTVRIDKDGAA